MRVVLLTKSLRYVRRKKHINHQRFLSPEVYHFNTGDLYSGLTGHSANTSCPGTAIQDTVESQIKLEWHLLQAGSYAETICALFLQKRSWLLNVE
jgi:hypothetical protein